MMFRARVLVLTAFALCVLCCRVGRTDEQKPSANAKAGQNGDEPTGEVRVVLLKGTVTFLGPALRKQGVKAYKEMDQQVVLITDGGEMVPLVADWRGRAFYQDKRLRDRKVELVLRRRSKIPYAQVMSVYTFDDKNRRQYTDYWCDICSIPMYEIKDCECCQGPIRLRFQDRPLPSYIREQLKSDERKDSQTKPDDKAM